jgi:hypothetical protein
MASQDAIRDGNHVTSLIVESASHSGQTVRVKGNETTGQLLVEATTGVVGPATSTDGAIALWDGATGLAIKDSNIIPGGTTTAPSTTATPVFTSYYGGNTKALGDPVAWLLLTVGGTAYKIPLYT